MTGRALRNVTAAALLALGAAACAAEKTQSAPPMAAHDCFMATDWHGWKGVKPNLIYLRVRLHDVYRIELTSDEPFLTAPDVHLVSKIVGPDMICGPLDLDLRLADYYGIETPLIAKSITKLTPEQIKALPPEAQP